MNYNQILKKAKKNEDKLNKERLNRCIPAAKDIMKMMLEASNNLDVGDDKDINKKSYEDLALNIMVYLLQNKIKYTERHLIFQLILQTYELTRNMVVDNLEKSYGIARDKVWGKEYEDITLSDLDAILKGEKTNCKD